MNNPDMPRDRLSDADGATTPIKGTPVAVDVSAKRQTKIMLIVFLAGPVLWSAHFLLVYLVVEAGCSGQGRGMNVLGPPVPTVVTLIATAVAAVACLATARWAYARWQTDSREPAPVLGSEPPDHLGALAFAGFLLSLLGFVSVLLVGVPALLLPACLP